MNQNLVGYNTGMGRHFTAAVLAGMLFSGGPISNAGETSWTDFSVVTLGGTTGSAAAQAGNLSTGGDITGNAFVSGTVTGLATVGFDLPTISSPPQYAVTVAGNLNFNNYANIGNGYSVEYTGSHTSGNFNFNGGGSLVHIGSLATEQQLLTSQITSASSTFSSMAPTPVSVTTDGAGNMTYKYLGNAGGVAVIDISATTLSSFQRTLDLNMNGASSVVIDVTGLPSTNFTIGNTFNWGGDFGNAGASKIIWNFGNLQGTLSASNQFYGSILAPDANFSTASAINGSIYVESFLSQSGEIHYQQGGQVVEYAGFDPLSVPEPSAIVLTGLGAIGSILLAVRHRKTETSRIPTGG